MMNEEFKAYLQYKTLAHRFGSPLQDGKLLDQMIADLPSRTLPDSDGNQIEQTAINGSVKLQNVCAKISVNLVKRLEANIEVLSMSKREFIELAIISALDETDRIFAQNSVAIPEYELEMEIDG